MELYTIGFTGKSAKQFFELLKQHQIRTMVDIRLNNSSQLSGFSKGNDLKYFLKTICNIEYIHLIELAPTKELFDEYRNKKIKWEEFEKLYLGLLADRNIKEVLDSKIGSDFEHICLLCSEASAEKCHRRLAAEYIKNEYPEKNISIVHI
jgi:uncharacterized protein (DUF488 family)